MIIFFSQNRGKEFIFRKNPNNHPPDPPPPTPPEYQMDRA